MAKRKRGRPPKKKGFTIKSDETKILTALILGFLGLLLIIGLFVDGTIFDYLTMILGIGAIPAGIMLLLISAALLGYSFKMNTRRPLIGFLLLTVFISATAHFIIPIEQARDDASDGRGGGYLGFFATSGLINTFGRFASVIILFFLLLIAISLISGVSVAQMKEALASLFSKKKKTDIEPIEDVLPGEQFVGEGDKPKKGSEDNEPKPQQTKGYALRGGTSSNLDIEPSDSEQGEDGLKYPDWENPPLDLLSVSQEVKTDPKVYEDKAGIIEKTLKSFGIHGKVSDISIGPRVVQYALSITVGTKVSKVKSLGHDLALALAAPSGSVRIEAPIPGTSLIGIEVPNQKPTFVTLGDMMTSKEMQSFNGKLPLILGKNIAGKALVRDLFKMPHLLVAGATGSGKSVFVNSFLCAMLMTHSPDYVKFILVDPKMVELPQYNGIPHLLTPVITDVEKVIYSLEWLVTEMQRRFRVLNKAGSRNVDQYNTKLGYPALPYIILVVDEMADIILSSGIDVESKIVRLAQMARAVGIHLVLATQRPSVDVLTGLIKANIPARIGMNVATTVDSRVILDMIGAESLLGDGDMLFKAPDISRPVRLQGSFVSNKEVEHITDNLRSRTEEVEYNKNVTAPQTTLNGTGGGAGMSEDSLFPDAVRVVVHAQKASSSLLQRKLRIGYNRAARLVDELHAAKIVGPQDGSKPRKVLITDADAFLNRTQQEAP